MRVCVQKVRVRERVCVCVIFHLRLPLVYIIFCRSNSSELNTTMFLHISISSVRIKWAESFFSSYGRFSVSNLFNYNKWTLECHWERYGMRWGQVWRDECLHNDEVSLTRARACASACKWICMKTTWVVLLAGDNGKGSKKLGKQRWIEWEGGRLTLGVNWMKTTTLGKYRWHYTSRAVNV